MKSLILLLVTVFIGQIASARSLAPLVCEKGNLGSDDHMSVSLLHGSVEITLHETGFDFTRDQTEVSSDRNSISVLNQSIDFFGEGETWQRKVSALLVYSPDTHTLNVTLIFDGQTFRAGTELSCN